MTTRNYKLIKYLSVVIYTAIVLAVLVKIFTTLDDTDKVSALYLVIAALCAWQLLFILTVRKVLSPPVSDDHRNSYLIVLGVFHLVPIYSTFVLLSGIIKGDTRVGWEIGLLTLLNSLLILNFFRADKTPGTR